MPDVYIGQISTDLIPPSVSNFLPTGTNQDPSLPISFDLTDEGLGVNLDSLYVVINSQEAVVDGLAQTGYNIDITAIEDGYHVIITPDESFDDLSTVDVSIDVRDLEGIPNVMETYLVSYETGDYSGPIVTNESPTPGSANHDPDASISFTVTDISNVDLVSVRIGSYLVENNVANPGFSVNMIPVPQGFNVEITANNDYLSLNTTHTVTVEASDDLDNETIHTWSFATKEGAISPPSLSAYGGDQVVNLSWTGVAETFQLVRSEEQVPTSVEDGTLIYEGTSKSYFDEAVVNKTTYYYSVFSIYGYSNGAALYISYDPISSASATPRAITIAPTKEVEYIPQRGDFGSTLVLPVTPLKIVSIWGRRKSDILSTKVNMAVRCPIRGIVIAIENQKVEVEAPSGIVITLSTFSIHASIKQGMAIEPGQLLGYTNSSSLEFKISKLPEQKTVRPLYFYATAEQRDGSR